MAWVVVQGGERRRCEGGEGSGRRGSEEQVHGGEGRRCEVGDGSGEGRWEKRRRAMKKEVQGGGGEGGHETSLRVAVQCREGRNGAVRRDIVLILAIH